MDCPDPSDKYDCSRIPHLFPELVDNILALMKREQDITTLRRCGVVSRQWHALALRYLFRDVAVHTTRPRSKGQKHAKSQSKDPRSELASFLYFLRCSGVGRYIDSLTILDSLQLPSGTPETYHLPVIFSDILNLIPHLRSLTTNILISPNPSNFVPTRAPVNIEYLKLTSPNVHPSYEHVFEPLWLLTFFGKVGELWLPKMDAAMMDHWRRLPRELPPLSHLDVRSLIAGLLSPLALFLNVTRRLNVCHSLHSVAMYQPCMSRLNEWNAPLLGIVPQLSSFDFSIQDVLYDAGLGSKRIVLYPALSFILLQIVS